MTDLCNGHIRRLYRSVHLDMLWWCSCIINNQSSRLPTDNNHNSCTLCWMRRKCCPVGQSRHSCSGCPRCKFGLCSHRLGVSRTFFGNGLLRATSKLNINELSGLKKVTCGRGIVDQTGIYQESFSQRNKARLCYSQWRRVEHLECLEDLLVKHFLESFTIKVLERILFFKKWIIRALFAPWKFNRFTYQHLADIRSGWQS